MVNTLPPAGAPTGVSPDSSMGQSRGKRWLVGVLLAALILAGAAAAVFFLGRSKVINLSGSPDTWSEAPQKAGLVAYLNAQVRLPGFQASCVEVSKKENYWSIAKKNQITIDTIVGLNPDLQNLNAYVGRALVVSNQRGTLHWVQAGDSAASIEKDYGLDPGTVKAANRLGWSGLLRPGQVLFLPGAKPKPINAEMAEIYQRRSLIRSPLAGRYTSLLGTRIDPFTGATKHHNGVDIKAAFNSPVAAAADGKVVLAGWNDGFGKCVIIDHADGLRTLYGHLNTIMVHTGQHVVQHQFIGRVGATGRTTGPHLHFTIWKDGKLQDPLKYLW
jgi:LysM repeat protein